MVAHSSSTVLPESQVIHSETADVNLVSTSAGAGPSDIDCGFFLRPPRWYSPSRAPFGHGEIRLGRGGGVRPDAYPAQNPLCQ